MRVTVKVPKLDDTTESVLVVEWHVEVGDEVTEGQPLLSVEGDKVEADLPSPVAGRVVERLADAEEEVPVGTPLAVIEN